MNRDATGPLMNHLPGIYHASEDLGELLATLEGVFFGPSEEAFERRIARIATFFDAAETPAEFLPWLAEWVALSHTVGLPSIDKRRLIAEIVPLYGKRGTKQYLAELLEFYSPHGAEITIEDQELYGLRVGAARIGVDSWLQRDRPFCFEVKIRAPSIGVGAEERRQVRSLWEERARQVIDLAKPAHTMYQLDWDFAEDA